MYDKEKERQYELNRKRNKRLNIRCTEEERELFYKLGKIKKMDNIELMLYLVNKELEELENNK